MECVDELVFGIRTSRQSFAPRRSIIPKAPVSDRSNTQEKSKTTMLTSRVDDFEQTDQDPDSNEGQHDSFKITVVKARLDRDGKIDAYA